MIEEAAAVVTDKSAIITFAVPVFFFLIIVERNFNLTVR